MDNTEAFPANIEMRQGSLTLKLEENPNIADKGCYHGGKK